MKTQLFALAAVAALTFGTGAANAASPAALEIAPQPTIDAGSAEARHVYHWRYREFWRGNCKYKTLYVTNGRRWAYRYVYRCF